MSIVQTAETAVVRVLVVCTNSEYEELIKASYGDLVATLKPEQILNQRSFAPDATHLIFSRRDVGKRKGLIVSSAHARDIAVIGVENNDSILKALEALIPIPSPKKEVRKPPVTAGQPNNSSSPMYLIGKQDSSIAAFEEEICQIIRAQDLIYPIVNCSEVAQSLLPAVHQRGYPTVTLDRLTKLVSRVSREPRAPITYTPAVPIAPPPHRPKKGELRAFILKNRQKQPASIAGESERLYLLATASGITTTQASIYQTYYNLRRSLNEITS